MTRSLLIALLVCASVSLGAAPGVPASSTREAAPASAVSAATDNPVVVENREPGTYSWLHGPLVADDTNGQMKGYWSATSVKQGETLTLHVSVSPAQSYTLDLYRLGWYQGYGARLRVHVGPLDATKQQPCVPDAVTGLIACDWASSYSLTVPSDWTSGVYLGLLTNATGYQNYAMFVVRDDRPAPFLFEQSITTAQAYNNYPNDGVTGKSLYTYNSYGLPTVSGDARAVKVSFDRPYADHGFAQFEDVEFIRWIERSGYDVTYTTNVDTHSHGARLLDHRAVLSVGHDEYWSKEIRDALEGARDAGVSLAFFAADTGSVQVRFEASAAGAPDRVMVCYKDASRDPVQGPTTTVAFRDPPVNRAEQSLRGVISGGMLNPGSPLADYVVTNSGHWIYAGTGFKDGDTVSGIVGYEMDRYRDRFASPNSADWTMLSHSPFIDYQGNADYAESSIYQAPSGAWVFSSGTISWSRGLDGFWYQRADSRIQQTTANLFDAFLNGPPSAHALQLAAPSAAAAGVAFSVTVTALDANGLPYPAYTGTVHFSATDHSAGVVLPPDSRLVNGTGTFMVTLVKAGPQTITISDAASSLSASAKVTVGAAAASDLVLATAATPIAGTGFSFTVTAKDPFGNVDAAYAGRVHFTSSDRASSVALPADATLTNGTGTFTATLVTAGTQTITAADAANAAIDGAVQVTVQPGAAATLRLSAPTSTRSGQSFSVTVTLTDRYGNVATGYRGTVHFTSDDMLPTVVLPHDYTFAAADAGSHAFSVTLWTVGSEHVSARDTLDASLTDTRTVMVRLF